ncbi:MutS family DNA mismatch repair protein [Staphylococcus haemolyticus]|uniref:MutS-related protein n=1 Tax=Staphylococcus haemolyticus TaxID=1283 RepID=UPI001F0B439C|nr:MutS family DNA mismatch repair protein [Staphylococcus haemolyticus]MCH4532828.1 MutS family DNA mismatch repair protein [Staphylococcus haemolyticus]
MNIYQTYALLVIGIIILGLIVNVVVTIVDKRKLINHIHTLWRNKKPIENFIRPNSRFDYQFKLKRDQHNNLIDDKTWSDLNMEEIFHRSNFNFTAIGEMRWFATLRNMFKVNNKQLLDQFNNDETFRVNVSYHLASIGKVVYPIFPDQLKAIKRNNLFMICPFLPFIGFIICFISPSTRVLITLFSILLNIVLSGTLKRTYDQDLKSLFYTAKVLKEGYHLDQIKGTPEVNTNFSHFKGARLFSGLLGKVGDQDIGGAFIMLLKMAFMVDYFLFHIIQYTYYRYQDEVMACYDYVSTLDNHYSLAMYRRILDTYCEPTAFSNEQTLTFTNLIHPLLENAVPNDLDINHNILLTGSNASGKSTFMKALAINLILAQTIETATADAFSYRPGLVYTSMANADDVLSGDSYFMAELKSIRRLFDIETHMPVYCFIDEIFKGTNTTERIAASESVLSYLNHQPEYRIVAATHDIELSELLKDNYQNFHFNETIENDEIHFDYKIKKGKANTRNAIELLRITNFPNKIYKRAKDQVKDLN